MTVYPLHTPVMLQEVIDFLQPTSHKTFLDATIGAGGHSQALLEKGAHVIGLDRDKEILKKTSQHLASYINSGQLILKYLSFSQIGSLNLKVDGVLFDLGVSSYQLDTPQRGFSFRYDTPLDMRMDQNLTVTAQDLVNGLTKRELIKLFTLYGEEKYASRIAHLIVQHRRQQPIFTTKQLADLVTRAKGGRNNSHLHPATKVFQALRMAVNDELNELKAALPSALSSLANQGTCVVISFHSLEDAIVKKTFNQFSQSQDFNILTPKPLLPTSQEIANNPRSRSAKLRAIRRQS